MQSDFVENGNNEIQYVFEYNVDSWNFNKINSIRQSVICFLVGDDFELLKK